MRISGKVSDEIKYAAEFFAGELIKDGRQRRHLNIDIEMDPTLDGWAGICVADEDRIKPKYFTIKLNPVSGDNLIKSLAHEMVHIKQYVVGELYDMLDGTILWKDEIFRGQVAYAGDIETAPPWEIEAYASEFDLYETYQALINGDL